MIENQESITEDIAELGRLAEYCNFGRVLLCMLLDQLVCGLKQCIRLHLLSQCKMLTSEIDIAQTMESAIKQSSLKR